MALGSTQSLTDFFFVTLLLAIRTKLYTIHIKFTVLWANEMSFKASGGLISSYIIPHKGTEFYSPLRSHGQMRLSRFGFLTSTKLMANWFSCSCNRWKCLSTLFWRSSSTVVMLRSAWNRNENQEYFRRCKGDRCLRLTTLPPWYADCLEIWEPQPPGTLRPSPDL